MPRSKDPENYRDYVPLVEQVAAGNEVMVPFATREDAMYFIRRYTAGFLASLTHKQKKLEELQYAKKEFVPLPSDKEWMDILFCARLVDFRQPIPFKSGWGVMFRPKSKSPVAVAIKEALKDTVAAARDENRPRDENRQVAPQPSEFDDMAKRLLQVQADVDAKDSTK